MIFLWTFLNFTSRNARARQQCRQHCDLNCCVAATEFLWNHFWTAFFWDFFWPAACTTIKYMLFVCMVSNSKKNWNMTTAAKFDFAVWRSSISVTLEVSLFCCQFFLFICRKNCSRFLVSKFTSSRSSIYKILKFNVYNSEVRSE